MRVSLDPSAYLNTTLIVTTKHSRIDRERFDRPNLGSWLCKVDAHCASPPSARRTKADNSRGHVLLHTKGLSHCRTIVFLETMKVRRFYYSIKRSASDQTA